MSTCREGSARRWPARAPRALRLPALAALGTLVAAACTPAREGAADWPAPPPSAAPVAATVSTSAPAPAPEPARAESCERAGARFSEHRDLETLCAVRRDCPTFGGWVEPQETTPRADRHGPVAVGGGFVLETVAPNDARVYELGPSGARLRYLVDWGDARLLGARLWVEQGGAITLVDLASGATTDLGRVRFVAQGADYFYASDDARLLRWRRSDLSAAGAVGWDFRKHPLEVNDIVPVRGGAGIVVGDALADFDAGRVVYEGVSLGAVRHDGGRVVGCDAAVQALVEVDTTTGVRTATFGQTEAACEATYGYTTKAVYADARHPFWGEVDRANAHRPSVVVAVGDTTTSAVQRFVDRRHEWGVAPQSVSRFDAALGRLCLGFGTFNGGYELCAWRLSGGRAAPVGPAPPAAGLPARADLVADAWSPSGVRSAVLYERALAGSDRELAVVVVDGRQAAQPIVVKSGALPWGPLRRGEYQTMVAPVGLFFLDEDHLAILPSGYGVPPSTLVDVPARAVRNLCPTNRGCELAGGTVEFEGWDEPYDWRFAQGRPPRDPTWIDGHGVVADLTGATYSLVAPEDAWEAATHIVPSCTPTP